MFTLYWTWGSKVSEMLKTLDIKVRRQNRFENLEVVENKNDFFQLEAEPTNH